MFSLSDLVFVVGEGDSSREMFEIVDIGYKASEKGYVYDCMPLYNPALQGLFMCRDKDLRRPKFLVGESVGPRGSRDGMKVLGVRYWSGRFCYRIGKGGHDEGSEDADDNLLLEEEDLVRMMNGRGRENERP